MAPLDQHLQARRKLLAEERTRRHDHTFKEQMSQTERKASEIIQNLRKKEHEIFWTPNEKNEGIAPSPTFPGMAFSLSRQLMQQSQLWQIVSRMPKGALLHAHMEAMIDIDWMIEQALTIPGFWMSSAGPLTTDLSTRQPFFQFHYRPETDVSRPNSSVSIWQAHYPSHEMIPVQEVARTHPDGVAGFQAWTLAHMTISTDEALDHHSGVNDIWKKFTSCFPRIAGLFYNEPILRRCVPRLLHQLHSDGINYVELRMVPAPFYREGSDTPEPDTRYYFTCLQQEINAYRDSPAGAGFWGARVIWTAIRSLDDDGIRASMRQCIETKKAFPDLIAGFDFVGQEDVGRPLMDLLPLCFEFQEECAALNIQIPFFFHAGECLGDGDSTDGNLVDAILLRARRIGHGFSLYKHPTLIEKVKEQQILIEVCPVSHEILRLTSSILTHPMPALQAHGVKVSLSNDDPAILGHGANGLTHDFYQVLLAFENTGLGGLATMAQDSIRWAAFEDETEDEWRTGLEGRSGVKAERIRVWREALEEWCQWIVAEFSADAQVLS